MRYNCNTKKMTKSILLCCSIVAAVALAEGVIPVSQSSQVCSVPVFCNKGGVGTRQWKTFPEAGKNCERCGNEEATAEIQESIEYLQIGQAQINEKLEALTQNNANVPQVCVRPASCDDVSRLDANAWDETGGMFTVFTDQLGGSSDVYCDLTSDGGRWTVFQRRVDGSEDFYRGWDDYVSGFGDKEHEFWMGLEMLHQMTAYGKYELRIDMEDWDGNTGYAKYATFSVGNREGKYRLTVGGYSGDAGDSMLAQNGQMFTTKDNDNDQFANNCAVIFKGAWWHGKCHQSNLNGEYSNGGQSPFGEGINWFTWKGYEYSLKATEMKFRRLL